MLIDGGRHWASLGCENTGGNPCPPFDEYNKVFPRTADGIGSNPYTSTNELRSGPDDLVQVVGAALEGDQTTSIIVEGNDANGQIGSALGRFFASLVGDIREISVNADDLNEFSEKFEALNEEMHGLAHESASKLKNIAGSMHALVAQFTI